SLKANMMIWKQEASNAAPDPYSPRQTKNQAFWRTLMADRMKDWSRLPSDSENIYFETFMAAGDDVPPEFKEAHPEIFDEDMKRMYVKPFTDVAVPRCHGRSFVITSKGYIGLAP